MTAYIKDECYGDRTHTPCSKCPYLHYPFCTENMDEEQKRIIICGDDGMSIDDYNRFINRLNNIGTGKLDLNLYEKTDGDDVE